jgi:hypothetical protein
MADNTAAARCRYVRHADEAVNRYLKRLIRDLVRYRDEVFCHAGRIIAMAEAEAGQRGYSSFHIRRGDFQFEQATTQVRHSSITCKYTLSVDIC